jgi:DUF1680 family protein
MGNVNVPVEIKTNFPMDGVVNIAMNPDKKTTYSLNLRLPGWAKDQPVPGDLYRFEGTAKEKFTVTLNGKPVEFTQENGYVTISRKWSKGDVVQYSLPMEIRKVKSRNEVEANRDRIALQRGPLVYCVEGADNAGRAWNIVVPVNTEFQEVEYQVLNERVMAIQANVPVVTVSEDGSTVKTETKSITAIPYYTWANRGASEMQVWLPTKVKELKVNY